MKSLRFMHSAQTGGDSKVPPKLKTFNSLPGKLSSVFRHGGLFIMTIASLLLIAPDAMANNLRRGIAGPEVARLQSALGIHVDGLYGRQTASAVAAYQRSCGLLVDGIAGPQTLSSLYSGGCGGGYVNTSSYCGDSCSTYESNNDYQSSDDCGDDYPCYPTNRINPQGNRFPERAYQGGQYVVVVPDNDPEDLVRVREYVPGAFPDATLAGGFINAGQFDDYSTAARTVDLLEGVGFDAQVKYREYYD